MLIILHGVQIEFETVTPNEYEFEFIHSYTLFSCCVWVHIFTLINIAINTNFNWIQRIREQVFSILRKQFVVKIGSVYFSSYTQSRWYFVRNGYLIVAMSVSWEPIKNLSLSIYSKYEKKKIMLCKHCIKTMCYCCNAYEISYHLIWSIDFLHILIYVYTDVIPIPRWWYKLTPRKVIKST